MNVWDMSDAELAGAIEIRPETVSILGVRLARKREIPIDWDHFAPTRMAIALHWRAASGVSCNKPVLLEGDTGIGKDATIEHLATMVGMETTRFQVCKSSENYFLDSARKSCQSATWFIIDDVNIAEDGLLSVIQRFIDDELPQWKHVDFRLFGTQCPARPPYNPMRRSLPASVLSRWVYSAIEKYAEREEEPMAWLTGDREGLARRIIALD